jgi:hypothetical protein
VNKRYFNFDAPPVKIIASLFEDLKELNLNEVIFQILVFFVLIYLRKVILTKENSKLIRKWDLSKSKDLILGIPRK